MHFNSRNYSICDDCFIRVNFTNSSLSPFRHYILVPKALIKLK